MTPMHGVLILGALLILWSVYRTHLNQSVDFNLLDLLMENGRVSKVSCIVMGSFSLHSWIMLDLELAGKMSEGYLTIYGATWIAPLLARIFTTNDNAVRNP